MKRLVAIALVSFLGLTSYGVSAHNYVQGDISVGHIWSRATALGVTTAAVYVPLLNNGKEQDKLLGASSDIASKVEIHEDRNDNGAIKTTRLDYVVLDPGKPVSLRPGGIHLMIFGLKHHIEKGEMLPLELEFEKAGTAKVMVKVEAVDANQ